MIALLLAPLAWSGGGDFALRATVSCPEQGVCRVPVPPQMSATGDALLLEDAMGRPVPIAWLSYLEAPDRWLPVTLAPGDAGGWRLGFSPPISAVRLTPGERLPVFLQLRSRRDAGQHWWEGAQRRVSSRAPLVLPATDPEAGQVEVLGAAPRLTAEVGVLGAVREVSGAVETHGRWAVITFSEPATVRRLVLPGAPDGPVNLYGWRDVNGTLTPQYLGSYPCQGGAVVGFEVTGRRLAVELSAPATITTARGWAPRDVLLVRDAGAVTLYGGADGDSLTALQDAADELLALPWTGATVAPVQPNPDYRGGLSLLLSPGAPVEPARFRFSRSLSGAGLVRIPLPAPMLLQVHRDLRDLRVLDAEGRQLPYIVVDEVGEEAVEPVSVAQEARPGATRLTVTLPRQEVGDLVLVLSTPARGFSRRVSIDTGRASLTRQWEGQEELRVDLDGSIGDRIVVTVRNGDDPPLPLEAAVMVKRQSLLAGIGEGSRLVYGDRAVLPEDRGARLGRRKRKRLAPITAPRYDLRQHGAAILDQAAGVARVGPEQAVLLAGEGPEQQRILLATVLAALVMVGVLGRVLLSARDSGADGDEGGRGA